MTKIEGNNVFRIGQKVKVINIDIFGPSIKMGDIGIITDIIERPEEYEIYFPNKDLEQYCLIYCSKTYLELVHNVGPKRKLKRKLKRR